MGKGFIFSLDALFAVGVMMMIFQLSLSQLEVLSEADSYKSLRLEAMDETITASYLGNTTTESASALAKNYSCEKYYDYSIEPATLPENGIPLTTQGEVMEIQKCVEK